MPNGFLACPNGVDYMSRSLATHPKTLWILPAAITLLALMDGLIHFALDFVLFHGRFVGSSRPPGPPPGGPTGPAAAPGAPPMGHAPMPFPLPLNELFLLNAVGYLGLVALYWISSGWMAAWRWLVDLVMIVYTLLSIVGWLQVGGPNPHGLGYLSKGIEAVLIVLLIVDAVGTLRTYGLGRRELSVATRSQQPV